MPLVCADDLFDHLLNAIEALGVVASESMQPQTAAEFMRTLTLIFDRLPSREQRQVGDLIGRSLSALGDHVLTAELDAALTDLVVLLDSVGRDETAGQVRAAQAALSTSAGKLGSRATRVKG